MTPRVKAKRCTTCSTSLTPGTRNCPHCANQRSYRVRARKAGLPLCSNGHGRVPENSSIDGLQCLECHRLDLDYIEPLNLRPAATWLDWAAVQQAFQGLPLVRPLTKRELLCLAQTLRVRYRIGRETVHEWISESTHVTDVSLDYMEYLERRWARGEKVRRLKHLVVTAEEAMHLELAGTIDDEWPGKKRIVLVPAPKPVPGTRYCPKCEVDRPAADFAANRRRVSACRSCAAGQVSEASYRNKAKRAGAVPVVGVGAQRVTPETLVARWGDACAYQMASCSQTFDEVAHDIAVTDGGPHTLDNCRPCCRPCSLRRRRMRSPSGRRAAAA